MVPAMGRIANALWGKAPEDEAPAFAVDESSIDPAVFGLTSYAAPTSPAPRIDRRAAIQVPAVKRTRDLIAGSLGTLPFELVGPDRSVSRSSLLDQPEANVPRSVTMTRLVEDLLFEAIAWWQVEVFGWHSYPTFVKRLDPRDVSVDDNRTKPCAFHANCSGAVTVKGKHVADAELIRFDSPNDALLVAGARAIRTALALDAAAFNTADGVPPMEYFTPKDPNARYEDGEVEAYIAKYLDARRRRSVGFVGGALDHHDGGWDPAKLQMAEARQHAVLEIARVAGVDPEELGVSTTSRTYANQFDRRKAFTDFTLGAYVTAIQDRLSMGDVTQRGYLVRANFDQFLRADSLTLYQTIRAGLDVGAIDSSEVRGLADRPPLTTSPEAAPMPQASLSLVPKVANFDTAPELRLDAPGAQAFTVDVERRTITGLAVPYGVPARSNGQWWQFSQGTLKWADPTRVKLWIQHDKNRAVGFATALDDTPEGLRATFKIARGAEGDHALSMAEDGVWDGLSVGLGMGGQFARKGDINHAVSAPVMEISLTPAPSFDDARVHQVAAQADTEGTTMKCTKCGQVHAEGVTTCDPGALATFAAGQPDPAQATTPDPAFSATIAQAIQSGFAALQNPQEGRQIVSPAGTVEVREELPYRFDGVQGAHSFTQDIKDAYTSGDQEARQRLDVFMEEAFAVTVANVGALNPTQNRPELFVPNLSFSRPLWDLVSTGIITDKTPFTVPKFSSASGLVGNHTEGVEPTPGAFAATAQTVSPGAVSGKIEINREVWDQGGSPQSDGIIWGEMLNGWYEAIEAKIAAALATTATAELNLASAVDVALQDALINYYASLQFVRGGNRFTATAADAKLFPALIAAKDSTGRKLFPVLGPVNAAGQVSGAFDAVQVGNQKVAAAWALGQGANTRSYNFVPSSVWAWASAPKRFTFEYQVKSVDMAIWGYVGTAILRDSDVKPIDYDVSDV
jgi:HK97 family phage prohead protease